MSWMIVSDSSCELRTLSNAAPGVAFSTVPLKIRVGEREFVDNAALDVDSMIEAMHNFNGASTTACPSPEEWAEKFLMADQVLAVTISSNLSGSYNSAMVARDMVLENHPEKKIHVLDTLSTGGEMTLAIWKANDLIAQAQAKFKEMRKASNDYVDDLMRRTDESLSENLAELRKTRQNIKSSQRNSQI